MSSLPIGIPPRPVLLHLRVEGLAALVLAVTAYASLGGSWWMFALLLLAPDLAFFGYLVGARHGARLYNLAHTYSAPAVVGAIGWFGGLPLLVEIAVIWVAHIGMDRALGYGLKYPGLDGQTHLGPIGKRKAVLAHAS